MLRIKVNRAHPTGSINMRDGQNRPFTVGTGAWVKVDEISPSIEVWRNYLIIEEIAAPVAEKSAEKAPEKPKEKAKGKRK